jgi:hypothetical protein
MQLAQSEPIQQVTSIWGVAQEGPNFTDPAIFGNFRK